MDPSRFLPLFLAEADEQLHLLEQGVLALEQSATPEVIQALFRTAHTLKGSSASMGFVGIAGLTHRMENVLDRLRDGRLDISRPLVDLLLECSDALKALREDIGAGRGEQTETADLCRRLDEISQSPEPATAVPVAGRQAGSPQAPSTGEAGAAPGGADSGPPAHGARGGAADVELHIRLMPDCLMKGARMLTLLRRIEAEGSIVTMQPSLDSIEREEFDRQVTCVVATRQSPEALRAALAAFPDVEAVDAVPIRVDEEGPPLARMVAAAGSDGPTGNRRIDERMVDLGPEARGQPPEALAAMRQRATQTIRVDVQRLDQLMNLVGELVIDRIRLARVAREMMARPESGGVSDVLRDTARHLASITTDLQSHIIKVRMLPIEQLFSRFPRFVRDLAQKAGKRVDLVMSGGETELDRSVIEQIGDPLIHLLRNAVDHGIEPPEDRARAGKPPDGQVRLSASQAEGSIVVVVEDDGAGIDAEKVRTKAVDLGVITPEQAERLSPPEALDLIFVPGLSTARTVSDVSGRGVGMDIVRSNVQAIGGSVSVESAVGRGTRFVLRFPLTLAILQSLLVHCSGDTYALPLSVVHEIIEITEDQIQRVNGREATVLRGAILPLVPLGSLLGIRGPEANGHRRLCVVAGAGGARLGLLVDRVIGEEEVVIKPLGSYVGDIAGLSGATVLGDGRVALILDVPALIRLMDQRKERAHVC